MLTEYQVQKVRRDMESELNAHPARLFGCLAGLVAIVVLAAAQPQIAPGTDAATVAATSEQSEARPARESQAATMDVARATTVQTQPGIVRSSCSRSGPDDRSC